MKKVKVKSVDVFIAIGQSLYDALTIVGYGKTKSEAANNFYDEDGGTIEKFIQTTRTIRKDEDTALVLKV